MRAEGLDQQVEKYLKVKDDKVAAFVREAEAAGASIRDDDS